VIVFYRSSDPPCARSCPSRKDSLELIKCSAKVTVQGGFARDERGRQGVRLPMAVEVNAARMRLA